MFELDPWTSTIKHFFGWFSVYYWTQLSRTLLFWAAFILTRSLGAVVGDFLDKPLNAGGLALSRYTASAALLAFIVACILIFKQQPAIAGMVP